jgi:hypothetical protein
MRSQHGTTSSNEDRFAKPRDICTREPLLCEYKPISSRWFSSKFIIPNDGDGGRWREKLTTGDLVGEPSAALQSSAFDRGRRLQGTKQSKRMTVSLRICEAWKASSKHSHDFSRLSENILQINRQKSISEHQTPLSSCKEFNYSDLFVMGPFQQVEGIYDTKKKIILKINNQFFLSILKLTQKRAALSIDYSHYRCDVRKSWLLKRRHWWQ